MQLVEASDWVLRYTRTYLAALHADSPFNYRNNCYFKKCRPNINNKKQNIKVEADLEINFKCTMQRFCNGVAMAVKQVCAQ